MSGLELMGEDLAWRSAPAHFSIGRAAVARAKTDPNLTALRRSIRDISGLAHEINRIMDRPPTVPPGWRGLPMPGPSPIVSQPPLPAGRKSSAAEERTADFLLSQGFSPVCCVDCGLPSILIRDLKNGVFAVCCLACRQISHLETIEESK